MDWNDDSDDSDNNNSDSVSYAAENATVKKLHSKLYDDGYREGKAKEELHQTQVGFDEGFIHGMRIGRAAGQLYGACRLFLSESAGINSKRKATSTELRNKLDKLIFEEITGAREYSHDDVTERLRCTVYAISPLLMPAFEEFKSIVQAVRDMKASR